MSLGINIFGTCYMIGCSERFGVGCVEKVAAEAGVAVCVSGECGGNAAAQVGEEAGDVGGAVRGIAGDEYTAWREGEDGFAGDG